MKPGIPFIIAGIVFVLIPISLAQVWPYAKSEVMPADLSIYPNSYYAPKSERLSSWDDHRLDRLDSESDFEFATRMLATVHNATYHCEAHNYQQSWFTWLTWRTGIYALIPKNDLGVLDIKTFRCGFCHQRAFILARTMRQGGIESAEVLGLSGHVVTVFTFNEELFALDPDLGVGPVRITGLDSVNGSPDNNIKAALLEAYLPITRVWGNEYTNRVVDIFTTHDDNEYYVYKNLEIRRTAQSILFSIEKHIERYFIILGMALIVVGLLMTKLKIKDLKQLSWHINHLYKIDN
jgi:hypothetical protein